MRSSHTHKLHTRERVLLIHRYSTHHINVIVSHCFVYAKHFLHKLFKKCLHVNNSKILTHLASFSENKEGRRVHPPAENALFVNCSTYKSAKIAMSRYLSSSFLYRSRTVLLFEEITRRLRKDLPNRRLPLRSHLRLRSHPSCRPRPSAW